MNIFVTDPDPVVSAQCLPDRHIVKMPLETCQMLAIVCSYKWGREYGEIHKKDGTPYKTDKGAFRNHPCTVWANESIVNMAWLPRRIARKLPMELLCYCWPAKRRLSSIT